MDEDAVSKYVEHAQSTIESAPQMQEATTKAAVLRDFLDLLNWEIPADTQLEYSVKAFNRTYKVDYALVLEGTPVAFLEAKGVDTPLTQKHRKQLRAYLKNEDVNWGILTNGKEYEFYRREVVDSKVQVNSLTTARLADLSSNMTILRAFTKDAIQSGESEKIATRIHELKSALSTLDSEKGEIAEQITSLLTDHISETIKSHAESHAKEMIDRLSQDIANEIDNDDDYAEDPEPAETVETVVDDQSTSSDGGYCIEFVTGGNAIATFRSTMQVEAFVEAVEYLVENHNLIEKLEPLPYIPGRKRPLIHDAKQYDGREFLQPWELSRDYFIETNTSSTQKQRELRRLAERYDFEVEFSGGW